MRVNLVAAMAGMRPGWLAVGRVWDAAHHAEHGQPAGAEETDEQNSREYQKDDVEPGGVVPGHRRLSDARAAGGWHQAEPAKCQLHQVTRADHGQVEGGREKGGHPESVVLPVDVEDRQD